MKTKAYFKIVPLRSSMRISIGLALALMLFITNKTSSQTTYSAGKYQLFLFDSIYYDVTGVDTFQVATNYILIKLRDDITENERQAFESSYPITSLQTTSLKITLYEINTGTDFIELIGNLAGNSYVQFYDINHLCPLTDIQRPNDSNSTIENELGYHPNLLWPYIYTNLFEAWNITSGTSNIIVADLDDGLWTDHPDLANGNDGYSNLWANPGEIPGNGVDDDQNGKEDDVHGWNFPADNNELLLAANSHGTRMTSIIAAKTNNNEGIWGVAGGYGNEGASVMMLNCRSLSNPDKVESAFFPIAFEYAVLMGARIINMPVDVSPNSSLESTIQSYYQQDDIIFLGSAGNDNSSSVNYPARYQGVIAIGASQTDADIPNSAEYKWYTDDGEVGSNYGDGLDFLAPGGLFVADVTGSEGNYSPTYSYKTYFDTDLFFSTSRAVSFASGIVALMLSLNPCLHNYEVEDILKNTADKIGNDIYNYDEDGWSEMAGFGRINALKALNPPINPITNSTTWDSDRKILDDVIIENEGELTIQHCTISMAKQYKIIVKPGGKLILQNGAVLTGLCDQTWKGIEVWGISSEPQNWSNGKGNDNQGQLFINNATIQNAITAVELRNPEDNSTTGGIIDAEDAIFLNNNLSVHAVDYRNINDSVPFEMDYYGVFNDCSFILDEYYLGEKTFYKHIDLLNVKGIKFYGCSFTLNHEATNISEWNLGIAAYNAGFNVLPTCTTHVLPCPQIDSCRFSGFHWAIGSYNNSINPILIKNAHFDDNVVGIFVSSTSYPVILENFFEVGFDEGNHGTCGFANGLGIDIHSSIGFAVENNIFRKNLQAPPGIYAGIRAFWCPTEYDQIYKNDFRGLTYGNYAEGTNRKYPLESNNGIEYLCNQNYVNVEDFRVTAEYSELAMVRGTHGNKVTASGNRFSRSTSPYNWDFWYFGTQIINWHYCEAPCVDEKPVRIHEEEEEYFVEIESPESNDCPDHYGGGGHINLSAGEITEKELEFLLNQSDYNAVYNLYESLKDGGNTTFELNDIQIAEPDEMWDLRSQLLGHSPHLSQEVLRAVSDRTDVFPDNVLLEILAANPDELNRDTLLSYLEQKEDPLPGYMIEILRQAVGGVTYKTILLDEMARYHSKQHQAAQDIIRSILHDTLFDVIDYRDWLDNLGSIEADKQIISSYLHEKDTTNARTLLYLLPTLYELEGAELEDYGNYQLLIEMQIDRMANGKSIFDLDSLEIGLLEEIAIDGQTGSGNLARNILTYAYNHQYCDCLEFTDSTQLKRYGTSSSNAFNFENYALKVSASPNPAHTWVAINYELPLNETKGEIRITDITGKVIHHFKVNSNIGQNVWDTRGVPPGLYYVRLTSSGLNRSVKLVIL